MLLGCFILTILLLTPAIDGGTLNTRYILYDVNPGEGFNLRRDVYMRMAVFVRKLNIGDPDTKWVLVLPPWGHLYHWKTRELGPQRHIGWSHFFDLPSLDHFVPVIEFRQWKKENEGVVDSVYYLQGYKEGWQSGKFEEKFDVRDCLEEERYWFDENENMYRGQFFFFEDVFAKKFQCLSVQGRTDVVTSLVKGLPDTSIMLDRAENLLHDFFGDANYWAARRSMIFSDMLITEAEDFRRDKLDSTDKHDDTEVDPDWWKHRAERKNRGGNFGCVHMRRGDFARSRGDQVPGIKWVAKQLDQKLADRKLNTLFLSTDADYDEVKVLEKNLPEVKVVRFQPSNKEKKAFKDGGVAIIDQIICSHAQYFIGTRESTFTFRIQEEREIMGFNLEDTFDMLCRDGEMECEGGTQWKIDWGPPDKDWSLPNKKQQRSEL